MNISLGLVNGMLARHYDLKTSVSGVEGACVFRSARVYTGDMSTVESSLLYVGKDIRLEGIEYDGVVVFGYSGDMQPTSLGVIRVYGDMNYPSLYNIIIDIFEKLADWYGRMTQASYAPDAIEQIVDIAQEQLGQPMCVTNPGYKVYAMSDHPDMCKMSHSWKYAYNQGYLPLDKIVSFSQYDELRGREFHNSAILTATELFGSQFMNYVICKNDVVYGHFLVIEIYRAFYTYEFELANLVGNVLAGVLTSNTLFSSITGSIYEQFIIDVINGTLSDRVLIEKQLSVLGWSDAWRYVVVKLKSDNQDVAALRSLCSVIEKKLDNTSTVINGEDLIVIVHVSHYTKLEAYNANIYKLLEELDLYAGESDLIKDFCDLPNGYEQAKAAIALAGGSKRVVNYTESAMQHMIEKCYEHFAIRSFIHPCLEHLRRIDTRENTKYYQTLQAYIENDRVIGKTAEQLYLHRNTLMNRLEKIRQHTGINLDDFNMVKRLILSFAIEECLAMHRA